MIGRGESETELCILILFAWFTCSELLKTNGMGFHKGTLQIINVQNLFIIGRTIVRLPDPLGKPD